VIYENPAPDGRSRVNFNARPNPRGLRYAPGKCGQSSLPEKIGNFVRNHNVKAWIAKDYLQATASCRVFFQDIVYVFEKVQGEFPLLFSLFNAFFAPSAALFGLSWG